MAATNSVRIMLDGPRNTVLWVEGNNGATGVDPGSGGADLAYVKIIQPSFVGYVDLARKQLPKYFRIDKIEWDVQSEANMRVDLWWDATSPSVAYSCIGRANKYFREFGGLYPPAGLTGGTPGAIGISTTGSPGGYAAWTIILNLVKLGVNPA